MYISYINLLTAADVLHINTAIQSFGNEDGKLKIINNWPQVNN